MNRLTSRTPNKRPLLTLLLAVALTLAACGPEEGSTSDIDDLALTGVDFGLNSIIIENTGSGDVRTEDLWIYRDGEAFQLGIFTIEPRASILFSTRDLGDISNGSGEVALATSEPTGDPDSLLAYVAWGSDGLQLSPVATDAGLWPEGETVETDDGTVVIIRTDFTGTGPETWTASDEIG